MTTGREEREMRAAGKGAWKPECALVGEDGNVFNVIGRVRRALRDAGQDDDAREFVERAFRCGSYDEVLQLVLTYVEVH